MSFLFNEMVGCNILLDACYVIYHNTVSWARFAGLLAAREL